MKNTTREFPTSYQPALTILGDQDQLDTDYLLHLENVDIEGNKTFCFGTDYHVELMNGWGNVGHLRTVKLPTCEKRGLISFVF